MSKFTIKFGIASIVSLVLLVSACSKDSNQAEINAGTTVRLNIGQSYAKADPVKAASTGRGHAAAAQTVEIPFDNQYTLVATLTAEGAASAPRLKASHRAEAVSAGAEQSALKQGTTYYVAIFDAAGVYKETKVFTQGKGTPDFAIGKGQYTFVIYASGTNKALPTIEAGTTLSTANFAGLTADQDLMLAQVPFEVKDGQNVLNADLAHLFTQVSLKFDASAIGVVGSIAGASIEPSNAAVDVALADGALSFKGDVNPVTFRLRNTSGSIINSDSTFIATSATSNGIVRLKGVSIGGSAARDVNKGGWNLKPGVKYILEFTLKAPLGGMSMGGYVWAPGNLVYANGKYSFAAPNQLGSSWYYNWLMPAGVGTAPSIDQMQTYSADRDPCKMVNAAWRTPSRSEYEALFAVDGVGTDWQYKYNGAEGVFYGSKDLKAMSENPAAYLFFPGQTGGSSHYWTSYTETNWNASSVLFGGYMNVPNTFGSDNKTNAFQIRCVRN